MHEWKEVFEAEGSNSKTHAYQDTLEQAINHCFLLRATKKKLNNLPWMGRGVRKMIKDRRSLFVREGGERTAAWKQEKKRVDSVIKNRTRAYMDNQREHLLADDANRNFYKHIKNFATFEKPEAFNYRESRKGRLRPFCQNISTEYHGSPSLYSLMKSPIRVGGHCLLFNRTRLLQESKNLENPSRWSAGASTLVL